MRKTAKSTQSFTPPRHTHTRTHIPYRHKATKHIYNSYKTLNAVFDRTCGFMAPSSSQCVHVLDAMDGQHCINVGGVNRTQIYTHTRITLFPLLMRYEV